MALITITPSGGAPIPIAYSASDSQSQVGKLSAANGLIIQNNSDGKIYYGIGTATAVPANDLGAVKAGGSVAKDHNF